MPSPESTQSMSTRPGSRLVSSARRRPGQPSTSARPTRSLMTITVAPTRGYIQHTSGTLYAKSFIISSPNGQEGRKGYTEETLTRPRTLTLIWIILTKFQHFSTPDMDIRIVLFGGGLCLNTCAHVAWWRKQRFTYNVYLVFPLSFWEMMVCREVMWPNRFPVKHCPSSRPNQLNIFCDKWRGHIFSQMIPCMTMCRY